MKLIIISTFLILGMSGCLRNLNQSEFFRKLEIKKESWHDLVSDYQSAFETSIIAFIEEDSGREVERITFWGEGRYACGKVVHNNYNDEQVLDVGGTFFFKGEKRKYKYSIEFVPKEGGELNSPHLFY